jgi:hypothetical protein
MVYLISGNFPLEEGCEHMIPISPKPMPPLSPQEEAKRLVDEALNVARNKYAGRETPKKLFTAIKDRKVEFLPGVYYQLTPDPEYRFLFIEPAIIKKHTFMIIYYVKEAECYLAPDGGSLRFRADTNKRVYAFIYSRNPKSGKLRLEKGPVKLSEGDSNKVIEHYMQGYDYLNKQKSSP